MSVVNPKIDIDAMLPDKHGIKPLGREWGIKSTYRFYEDLITAWAEGRFPLGNLAGKDMKMGRIAAGAAGAAKVKQTYFTRGTHTALWNTIYGSKTFAQLTYDAPLWGMLKKVNWLNTGSGWRVISANATLSSGVAENGAIPNASVPTVNEVECKPKILATTWGTYDLMQIESKLGNDTIPIEEVARQYFMQAHVKGINGDLGDTVNTVHTNTIESLDRITSSNAELAVSDNPPAANDCDLAGYIVDGSTHDRDAGTGFTDAQLVHNDGTDEELTLANLNSLIRACRKAGNKNAVLVTNWEIADKLNDLLDARQRFQGTSRKIYSINGVQSAPGMDAGFEVATYRGIPIIVTDDLDDTTHEGSRIWMLDLDNLFIKVALPTMYLTSEDADKFALGYFRTDSMYVTMAELVCTKFYSQGKIRDLDAS